MQPNSQQPLLQVCQPGYDVRTCPDWAYLFNSNWPNLAIAWEKTINSPGSPQTYTHNLGFVPLAVLTNGINTGPKSYGRIPTGFSVTSTTVTYAPSATIDTITMRLYNVDVSKEQSYPLPQGANARLPYNNQFGIKMVKTNRQISSNNLNDFIIHSRAQSPAVLAVATEKGPYFTNVNPGGSGTGPWIVYPLKTSYIPWVYAMIQNNSNPLTYAYYSINAIQIINNQIVLPLNGNTAGSLVILRDPLFYPNTVSVVY